MGLKRSGWSTIACVAFLFAVNAAICSRLFHTEFTNQVASIESAFISFSRWMMDHWHDRTWMPLWIDGIPARQVYGPMLHTSVAWLALQTGWTPQHAFHFLTASTYCLGPVALFWLIDRVTLRRGAALLAGLLYSLISPSTWVFAGDSRRCGRSIGGAKISNAGALRRGTTRHGFDDDPSGAVDDRGSRVGEALAILVPRAGHSGGAGVDELDRDDGGSRWHSWPTC
ncbi:MAG: hypothetical protein WDO18_13155 [Acidobacteriota bacterium]